MVPGPIPSPGKRGCALDHLAESALARAEASPAAHHDVVASPGAVGPTRLGGATSRSAPLRTPLWATTARSRRHVADRAQAGLRVGAVDDPLEHEADRVADAVMAGRPIASSVSSSASGEDGWVGGEGGSDRTGTLRRSCTCGSGAPCTACGEDAEPGLRRKATVHTPSASRDRAPASVTRALAEPGHPLDAEFRSRLEPRLGADLGAVRVHTSSMATASAAAVGAQAYTVGEDVVFAAGEYAPSTSRGERLLVHELAHVLQSRAAGAAVVRRQPAHTETTLTVPANVCDANQTRTIVPAVATAQQWLRAADTRLTTYMGAMAAPGSQPTGLSLTRHFAASDATTVRYVQNRIRIIADRLRTDPGAPSPLNVQCHGSSDGNCAGAGAYVLGNLLVFCPSFFSQGQTWQIEAMIHEIAHSLPPASGPLHITDRAYQSDRLYGSLSPGEALTNAESYALLVQELATGPVGGTAARDTYEDCPADWRAALFTAMARAQGWTHHAQVVLHDSSPTFMAGWATQATTFLGGQSAAQLGPATSAYDQAGAKQNEKLDFECETDGGGRCATSTTYWYAIGDFHICPGWRALPTDDDRAEALLAGLFGYYRIVEDNNRRWNLAKLARALTGLFWAAPTAADVSGALTTDAAQPQPPAAPAPGPRPSI